MRAPTVLAVLTAALFSLWMPCTVLAESPPGNILVFENLTAPDVSAVLASSDRLVWDRQNGRAVALVPPGAMPRLESIPHAILQGLSDRDFSKALREQMPGFSAEMRVGSRYAVKQPATLVKPDGAPRQRPEASAAPYQGICLGEDFESLPIWYEDGGPWWHYQGGQPYNAAGAYYWLDDNCDSFSGQWEADAIMGGTIGATLPCGATYDYNTDSWLEYAPWITCLSGATSATLSFVTRLETEEGYDLFYYAASVDGTNYSGYSLSGNFSDTWYSVTQDMRSWYGFGDLTAYPQFALAFVFQSDDQVNQGFGVRVDDIALTANACASVSLSPPSLPGGAVGTSYSQTITATCGTAPYTYGVTTGTVPPGLNLSSAGFFTGTPTTAGSFGFTVGATDASGCAGSAAYSVAISGTPCPTITLSPAGLPGGMVGTAYSQTIAASGGTAPYTFAKTAGAKPPGLSLTSGGLLSGTPTDAGIFNFTVTATDAHGCTGSQTYSVTIQGYPCPSITISPSSLPGGTVGTPYSQTIAASGGTAPYTFAKTAGAKPPGLDLSSTGLLSGTPSQAGPFSFTVTATDTHGCTGSQVYSVTIQSNPCPAITLLPPSLPGGTVGTPYSQTIAASGGSGPYIFAKSDGTKPPGLNLTSGGLLSGTPSGAGTFGFTVTATDTHGCVGTQVYSVTISPATCPAIVLSPAALPGGTVGVGYSQTITAAGGTAPYTFAKTAGTKPPGLNLTSGGLLSGTPTSTGPFSFTVTATDAHGCTGSQGYSITVNPSDCPAITITPASLPGGTVGTGYYLTLGAIGGTPPYTFDKTAGTKPPGLTLSSTGLLSGNPTDAGTFTFTITATDAHSCAGSQTYTMVVSAVPPPVVTAMVKMVNPFRIVVYGSNLQSGIKVYIDANRWRDVGWKGTTRIVLKGGAELKAAVPQGTPRDFTFVNPDGGAAIVTGWSW